MHKAKIGNSRPKVLIVASFILLAATGVMVARYGQQTYFVIFHKPFHVPLTNRVDAYAAVALPKFQVQPAISSSSLAPGDKQYITITATSSETLKGYMKVWIESPAHKQVFRSSIDGVPVQFVADKPHTFVYDYTLPASLPKGTYRTSVIITSPNNQTDYYVKLNFGIFTVS